MGKSDYSEDEWAALSSEERCEIKAEDIKHGLITFALLPRPDSIYHMGCLLYTSRCV